MRQAFIAAVATLLLVLLGSTGLVFGESAPRERKPAIVLAPPSGQAVEPEEAPVVEAEVPDRPPPPIARKKPTPPKKKVTARQRAPEKPAAQKAPAKKAPAKKAPAKKAVNQAPPRAAASPAPQAKDCDYCYGCESLSTICKRQWVCGKRYTDRFAAGLCRR